MNTPRDGDALERLVVLEPNRLHAVRVLGEYLRSKWGLWCGFLRLDGSVQPISPQAGRGPIVCDRFQQRSDSFGSCSSSLRLWADEIRAERIGLGVVQRVECHASLQGLLCPIVYEREPWCALYVTGFWEAASQHDQSRLTALRSRALGLPGIIPATCLDEEDEKTIVNIMSMMCREVVQARAAIEGGKPLAGSTERQKPNAYQGIIGQSEPVLDLFRTLDKIVASDSTVLIQGENGTGKELIARAIHFNSRRKARAFVVQNCSALNDNLLDSELFGHKRGSFTGAVGDKKGLFELAHGGTFFLDEVGDMSPTLQVKLLRVLQEGTFQPVGGTVTRKVDVRIIAATNRDLKSMVAQGTFREDLYYRLNVINLVSPPLRDRREDIPLLVDHFLDRSSQNLNVSRKEISEAALQHLMAYRWPGNIRELENEVERLVVLAAHDTIISESLLSKRILSLDTERNPTTHGLGDLPAAVEALERRMILEGLRRTGWNKSQTARDLGVSRRNLIRKVDRYDLDKYKDTDVF